MRRLTPKQEKFAAAVARGTKAMEAYRQAYNSSSNPKTVHREAQKLLKHPSVAPRIEGLRRPTLRRLEASVERSIEEMATVAYATPDEPLTWAAKVKALEMLGRVQGVFERDNKQRMPNLALEVVLVGPPCEPPRIIPMPPTALPEPESGD